MKISVGAVIALVAASASGFSITMSSYLDNLASGSTLSSFSQGGGAAVAPAPSAASPAAPAPAAYNAAPAPAPYQSAFADLPASASNDYIGTIAGGSQMKSGPNYQGMSRTFRASHNVVSNSVYLENLKQGNAMTSYANGASAPANGFAAAPAPAFSAPAPAVSAPAPAPYQGAAAGAGVASAISGYIGTIGGGSQMKPGPNYTGMSSSFKPSQSISNSVYLDSVSGAALNSFSNGASSNGYTAPAPAPAPAQSYSPAPAAPAFATSSPSYAKPSSYMPQPSGRVANTGIGNYLDALA